MRMRALSLSFLGGVKEGEKLGREKRPKTRASHFRGWKYVRQLGGVKERRKREEEREREREGEREKARSAAVVVEGIDRARTASGSEMTNARNHALASRGRCDVTSLPTLCVCVAFSPSLSLSIFSSPRSSPFSIYVCMYVRACVVVCVCTRVCALQLASFFSFFWSSYFLVSFKF